MQKYLDNTLKLPKYYELEGIDEPKYGLFVIIENDNYSDHWEDHKYVVYSWKTKMKSGYYEERGAFDYFDDAEFYKNKLQEQDTS